MRHSVLLLALVLVGCGVDQRCDHVCSALCSISPDADGCLPRDAVFRAAGISAIDLMPFGMQGRGSAVLECGCWLEFTERFRPELSAVTSIDEILNNPNRTRRPLSNQLESVVIIDRTSREICRLESTAARRRRTTDENNSRQCVLPNVR